MRVVRGFRRLARWVRSDRRDRCAAVDRERPAARRNADHHDHAGTAVITNAFWPPVTNEVGTKILTACSGRRDRNRFQYSRNRAVSPTARR